MIAAESFKRDVVEFHNGNLTDEQYESMSPREKLDGWLAWNGIIGWTDAIIAAFGHAGFKEVKVAFGVRKELIP